MWDYLHATDETDPLGSVNMGYSITELFDEFEGDIDHLLRFQAPEPLSPGLVSFHLSDLPFQRSYLHNSEIISCFGEYLVSIT